jgi:hypothetical protein
MKKQLLTTIGTLSLLITLNASAQQQAILDYTGAGTIVGYSTNGAGFAFSPLESLTVTSLGYGGRALADEDFRVTLWNAGGNPLATALISTFDPVFNGTHYEAISGLSLSAGQTYYLGAVGAESGFWFGDAILLPPAAGATGTITTAPDLTFLGGVAHGFPGTAEPDAFYVGANFLYVVPEPSTLALGAAGLLVWALSRRQNGNVSR